MKERAVKGEVLSPKETLLRFADIYEELLAMIDELDCKRPEEGTTTPRSRKMGGENLLP